MRYEHHTPHKKVKNSMSSDQISRLERFMFVYENASSSKARQPPASVHIIVERPLSTENEPIRRWRCQGCSTGKSTLALPLAVVKLVPPAAMNGEGIGR